MFENLEIMSMAQAMARHAAMRQNIVSQNIANADTPGYRARDVSPFSQIYGSGAETGMAATRAGHLTAGPEGGASPRISRLDTDLSPNGNSVSLEAEMVKAVEVRRQHDRALAIYKSSMNVLRASLGRG